MTVSAPTNAPYPVRTNLEFHVALCNQHIHCVQLFDISMLLKLLSDLCSYLRHWHVQRIHLLYLRSLALPSVSKSSSIAFQPQLTARSHSRYDRNTRDLASPQLIATMWSDLPYVIWAETHKIASAAQERLRWAFFLALAILRTTKAFARGARFVPKVVDSSKLTRCGL